MSTPFLDAQSALGFAIEQGRNVETDVYKLRYPNFDYEQHVPVVTEGPEWATGTIFFAEDTAGQATWISGGANDIRYIETNRAKYGRDFYMFGAAYEWNLEEINTARLYDQNLTSDKAAGVRKADEQFSYGVAIFGSTEKNYSGLINSSEVSRVTFTADGVGATTTWVNKTAAQRYRDLNDLLSSVPLATQEIEYVDTLRLPPQAFRLLASSSTGQGDGTLTQLEFFRRNNVRTAETGQPLDIKPLRSLAGAGLGALDRAMVYRRAREVVRFHLPMPIKFIGMRQKTLMSFEDGAISRTGGTEWRLPFAAAYGDGL